MKNLRLNWVKLVHVGATLSFVASVAAGCTRAETEQAMTYPFKTCLVSDEALGGDMGQPYVFTHQGREIKLCCKSCLKDFNQAPAKYLTKLDQAGQPGAKSKTGHSPAHDHSGHQH